MTKILFVCHGNICRSPMAEFSVKASVGSARMLKGRTKTALQTICFARLMRIQTVLSDR